MIIIGKYDEFGPGMGYPSIKHYLLEEPHPAQTVLLQYMKKAHVHMVTASRFSDAVTGETIHSELCFMNDGQYMWSSRIIYHVEKYNLCLPEAFVRHVLSQQG